MVILGLQVKPSITTQFNSELFLLRVETSDLLLHLTSNYPYVKKYLKRCAIFLSDLAICTMSMHVQPTLLLTFLSTLYNQFSNIRPDLTTSLFPWSSLGIVMPQLILDSGKYEKKAF